MIARPLSTIAGEVGGRLVGAGVSAWPTAQALIPAAAAAAGRQAPSTIVRLVLPDSFTLLTLAPPAALERLVQ